MNEKSIPTVIGDFKLASQKQPESQSKLARGLPIIGIAIVACVGAFTLRDYLSFDTLRENREALLRFRDANLVLCALAFSASYIAIVAFSLPGATIATLTGGFLFGTSTGTCLNVASATIGATLIFLAARHGLGQQLGSRLENAQGTVKRIKDGIDENQWSMLFLIRLVPAIPFFMANLIPAFLQVPLHRFAISTLFGILPGALVYTSVGAGLGEVFERGETPDLGLIFEPHILFPLVGLIVLALVPVLYKTVTGKKDPLK